MSVNPNMKNITFPSEHQYVIIDTSTDLPKYDKLTHIPMSFRIDYSRVGMASKNPPTLTLLINPNNMSLSFTKRVNPRFARDGFIVEEWGEEQDVIQCSGKIGGYYIARGAGIPGPESMNGLNRYSRSKSLSFKNIYKLLYIFRNNGCIFQNSEKGEEDNRLIQSRGYPKIDKRIPKILENVKNRIDRVGDVYLEYDLTTYLGSFDNFSMTEDANSPYTLEYSFQFTVQRTSTKDYRDIDYYNQTAFENSDVAKHKQKVKTVIKNVLNVQKASRIQEQAAYSEGTTPRIDTPVAEPNQASKVSPNSLALAGKRLLENNRLTVNYQDTLEMKDAFGLIDHYRQEGEHEKALAAKDSLNQTIKKMVQRSNTKLSDDAASAKANNFTTQILKDMPEPKPKVSPEPEPPSSGSSDLSSMFDTSGGEEQLYSSTGNNNSNNSGQG